MKRRKLMQHLIQHGCAVLREGALHTIVINRANNNHSQVPRHAEIKAGTAHGICKDLEIPIPTQK